MTDANLIEVVEREQYHLIKLGKCAQPGFLNQLERNIKSWLVSNCNTFVLDFENAVSLPKEIFPPLVQFSHLLKKNNKNIFSVNLFKNLKADLVQQGLNTALGLMDSIEQVEAHFEKLKSKKIAKIDAQFLKPFFVATQEVLRVQAQTELKALKPVLARDFERPDVSIAGVINLNADNFSGSIGLCFDKATFLKIYENMMGEKHEEINTDIQDAAGELLNIIYGQAKRVLIDEKNYKLKPAIPNVLAGEKLKIYYKSRAPVIILPFESTAGKFHIEIVMDDEN